MNRFLLSLLLLLLIPAKGICRDTVYVKSFLTIRAGTQLYIPGDLITDIPHDVGVRNSGEIHLTGNLENRKNKLFYWSTNGYSDFTGDTAVAKLDSILADTVKANSDSPLYRKGKVFFRGKDTQYILDTGNGIYFSDIYVHNQVVLNSSIHVQGTLTLKKNLDLNGNNLKLFNIDGFNQWGGSGYIVGESDTSQIIGDGDVIAIKGNPDAPISHLKTLGFELFSQDTIVNVRLIRKNDNPISIISDGSIRRTFTVSTAFYRPIDSIVLHYFNNDFNTNNHSSSDFAVWRYDKNVSSESTPYASKLSSVVDTEKKTVKAVVNPNEIKLNDTLVFTLASASCPRNSPRISLGNDIVVCDGNTVLLKNIHNEATTSNCKYHRWYSDTGFITIDHSLGVNQVGRYRVHIISEHGCEAFDSIYVDFRPNPKPEIRVVNAIGTQNLKCTGEPFLFKYIENDTSIKNPTIHWGFGNSTFFSTEPGFVDYSDSVYHTYILDPNSDEAGFTIELSVTSNGCIGNSVPAQVIVENTPLPTITDIFISDSIRLFKASNERFGQSINNMRKIWTVENDTVSSSDSLIHSFQEFGTYKIGLKMFSRVCEGDTNISIIIRDRADVQFSLNKKEFCQGESIRVLNKTTVHNPKDDISYTLWMGGRGYSFLDSLLVLQANDTGTFIVTLVASAPSGSWERTYVDTIRIHANPTINFGGEIKTCRSEITLKPQDTGIDYLWSNDSTSPTLTINQSGPYWLTMINEHWCISTESVHVVLSTTISSGLPRDTSQCGELKLSVNYPDLPSVTYKWEILGSSEQLVPDNTREINVTTSGTYIVTLTDSICQTTDTIFVDILKIPYLGLGRDTSICSNETITLSVVPQDSVSYLWNTKETGTAITIATGGIYSLTATHQNSCVNKDSIFISIKNAPVLNLGRTRLLCDTLPVDFNLITESGAATILWTLPDGTQNYGYLLSSSQVGTHKVLVRYTNGCEATDSVDIQRGNTGLVADFLLASALKLGDSILLANLSPLANPSHKNLQYQWTISDIFSSTEENPYVQFFIEGEFVVTLTVSDGSFCPAIKQKDIYVSSSGLLLPKGERINEDEQDSNVPAENFAGFLEAKLYPNPNYGDFIVAVTLNGKADLFALLADPSGRVLERNVFRNQSEYSLEYRNLRAGVYFLKLWSGRESRDFKIIVIK
jgi:hypothetical protein